MRMAYSSSNGKASASPIANCTLNGMKGHSSQGQAKSQSGEMAWIAAPIMSHLGVARRRYMGTNGSATPTTNTTAGLMASNRGYPVLLSKALRKGRQERQSERS